MTVTDTRDGEETIDRGGTEGSSALLGVVALAHDLQAPIEAIAAAMARVHRTCREPEALAAAVAVDEQLRRVRRYVADAESTALGRGSASAPSAVLDLRAVIREAIDACAPLVDPARCQLTLDAPEMELPVSGDADRLLDAVRSIVRNGCKYTPAGQVRVRARVTPDGDRAEVQVSDTGLGLTPAERQRLFTPLFRTAAARALDPAGRGLGLTAALRTVEQHGGELHVASEGPGRGTLVTLRLPLARTPRAPEPAPVGARRRVLVVEDWAELGEVFGELLRNRGLEVHVTLDGGSALEVATRLRPDLVFLDLGLPDMAGAEVGRRLRSADAGVVLVALTGRNDPTEAGRCLVAGFDEYVVKPIGVETLSEMLSLVEQRRSRAT